MFAIPNVCKLHQLPGPDDAPCSTWSSSCLTSCQWIGTASNYFKTVTYKLQQSFQQRTNQQSSAWACKCGTGQGTAADVIGKGRPCTGNSTKLAANHSMDTKTVDILVIDVRNRPGSTTLDMQTTANDSTGCNTAADALLIGTSVDDAEECCRQTYTPYMVGGTCAKSFQPRSKTSPTCC